MTSAPCATKIELTEISAPPFKESVRAAEYAKRLQALGFADARVDKEGNVIAVRKGNGRGPVLVVSAHLDTVFPEGTDVKVKKQGERYYAPGIYDDGRGLAALLSVIRALNATQIKTVGDVLFVYPLGVVRMISRTTGSARWKASLSSWMSGILT